MSTNLAETTVSLAAAVQVLSPVAVAVVGGASWTVKRVIGKIEAHLESLQEDIDDLSARCHKAEDKLRRESEQACKEMHTDIDVLRRECKACQLQRVKEREDCVDTYGKFGSRLTRIETEHSMHHRGDVCLPGK